MSKELTRLQTKLVQVTDPKTSKLEKESLCAKIKELEGELEVLSMRENEYRIALTKKEQELEKCASTMAWVEAC